MNAIIYARYSSDRQTEQSIDGQLRVCYDHAERCGYNIIGEYIDRAISGTTDNRPEFQRMIADSAKKQFQYILVYKLDRFARNRYDSAIYKTKLKKNGVKVISATEMIGDGDESIILEAVLEAMAETYSRQLSQNVKRGLKESAYKGYYTGGYVQFGYDVVEKRLQINEHEANIVRFIYAEYTNGVSKGKLINLLHAKGYTHKKGIPFNYQSLTHILNNRMYAGKYIFKDEIERECPRIISDDVFERCAAVVEANKRVYGHKVVDNVEYILNGKMFCGECGTSMIGESGVSRNGTKHHYYTCRNRKRNHACNKKNERKSEIEELIVRTTLSFIMRPKNIEYVAKCVVKAYEKSFSHTEIKNLEKKLRQINKEIDDCVNALIKSTVSTVIDKINEKVVMLELQKTDIKQELTKLQIANETQFTAEDITKWLKGFCTGDIEDIEFQKRIIDVLINCVYVYDDKCVIYYNIKGKKEEVEFQANNDMINNVKCSDSLCFSPPT